MMPANLKELARRLAETLRRCRCRVVFAESCTGGLVSAALAQVPGISEFHCGSAVVYRLNTKTRWLGVSADLLVSPGPVSEIVARDMVAGVLLKTPEADWSAAITGHLGPHAPDGMDGLVYIGIARRDPQQPGGCSITVQQVWLGEPPLSEESGSATLRERRQIYAAELVLQTLDAAVQKDRGG